MSRPRTVITGIGAITSLGCSPQLFWEGLLAGHSGVIRITQFDPSDFPCQIAGEAIDFDPTDYMEKKDARRMPRSSQFAMAATLQAIQDAGLPEIMPEPERTGVVFGTAIAGIEQFDIGVQILRKDGYRRVNPFIMPSGIPNLPAFLISRDFKCFGPNTTITTACATGTQAIGEAAELIRSKRADMVIAGGTESVIHDFAIGGFCAMRALPTSYNDRPAKASRPFDANREGFVFSEGSGVLVLEELEHALERGVHIYAELIGHASSGDGYHIAAPDPEAKGPARTMRWALEDAGIRPEDIDYINAHGTSTPLNDLTETSAIKLVFGQRAYQIPISSTKSMIGHAMGAAGALEAIVCAFTIHHGIIHPTINYETPDPECDLDYVPNQQREADVEFALSNSFGLGGQNACLVLKKFVE
jgi:beta-ketoacyl-acyl-carrier-protein synthase II